MWAGDRKCAAGVRESRDGRVLLVWRLFAAKRGFYREQVGTVLPGWHEFLPEPKRWVILMPVVLREGGMSVVIHPPPREHGPPHVHVLIGGEGVVISMGKDRPTVRKGFGMRLSDIARAKRLVIANEEYLLRRWREIHGD